MLTFDPGKLAMSAYDLLDSIPIASANPVL